MDWLQISFGFITSALLAWIIIPIMIKAGIKFSLLDLPGKHKRHNEPTPILGGAALFLSFWITTFLGYFIFPSYFAGISGYLPYVFSGALIILLVGLADDLYPLSAWVKLIAQVAAGLIIFMGGMSIDLVSTPEGSFQLGSFSVILTVAWVVILSNAINLIDGLDGLASGVSLIGALVLLIVSMLYNESSVILLISALSGFLIVFLKFNLHPARIFLGDSGSMQIGFYFAVISLIFPMKSYTISALYIPVLVLGLPILEAGSSFVRRLLSGKNVMSADRRHLFHYLELAGIPRKQVVYIFYFMAMIFGSFALAMFFWDRIIVFGYLVFFMVVIFSLFFILIVNLASRKKNDRQGKNGFKNNK